MDLKQDNSREKSLLELQKEFCERNGLPLFAHTQCSHDYPWVRDYRYGNTQTFDEIMHETYDDPYLVASSEHIISCPVCSRSWCD